MPLSGWTTQKQIRQRTVERPVDRQILVFTLSHKELGLDLPCVREVLRLEEVHSLPRTPPFIVGVTHLRGRFIPLIDLRRKVHPEQTEAEPCQRIIVCRLSKFIVGLTVETLKEIISLPKENVMPVPEMVSRDTENDVLLGIGRLAGRVIPILNLERVLSKKEIADLSALEL